MKESPLLTRPAWLAIAFLLSFCISVHGKFAAPQPTPIDQLLKTAEAFRSKHPESAEGYYVLGRIHYLGFHLKHHQIPAFRYAETDDTPPRLSPQWMLNWGQKQPPVKQLASQELVAHAVSAMRNFKEAARLNNYESPGLIHLGMASLEEEFAAWNEQAKVADLPPEFQGITLTRIRADYAQALAAAMVKDGELGYLPISGLEGVTSFEAATALVRLAEKSDTLTDTEKKDVERAKDALKFFHGLGMGAITPMVFSFRTVHHLDELLAPEVAVDFDLRGYGPRERWSWLRPELGLLVWDPLHRGRIESARQLFGGYTFEIFRANGYDALAALDTNGDEMLSGAELDGISVWFDRNGDGVSTPNEVTPLRDLDVVAVATTVEGYDGTHPTNARGITLRDGRMLRTWDWMVQPVSGMAAPLAVAPAAVR